MTAWEERLGGTYVGPDPLNWELIFKSIGTPLTNDDDEKTWLKMVHHNLGSECVRVAEAQRVAHSHIGLHQTKSDKIPLLLLGGLWDTQSHLLSERSGSSAASGIVTQDACVTQE